MNAASTDTTRTVTVSVIDPDLGLGAPPAFDGTPAEAVRRLTPGTYPATGTYPGGEDDEPVEGTLTVAEGYAFFTPAATADPAPEDSDVADVTDDGARLGVLLDQIDWAANVGGEDGGEITALRNALDTAVAMLTERGVEIPRRDPAGF